LLEAGLANAAAHAVVFSAGAFVLNQESQALFERQFVVLGGSELVFKGFPEGGKSQDGKLV
jgi:hypothetical protein